VTDQRPIDANALLDKMDLEMQLGEGLDAQVKEDFLRLVDAAPTLDASTETEGEGCGCQSTSAWECAADEGCRCECHAKNRGPAPEGGR